MTGVDLDEVRRLCAAATPGPWGVANDTTIVRGLVVTGPGSYRCTSSVAEVTDEEDREDWGGYTDGDMRYVLVEPEADAAFIAAARDLVPALADEVERLRAELARATARERERIADWFEREADMWRVQTGQTAVKCEYDWAAEMIRDLGPDGAR